MILSWLLTKLWLEISRDIPVPFQGLPNIFWNGEETGQTWDPGAHARRTCWFLTADPTHFTCSKWIQFVLDPKQGHHPVPPLRKGFWPHLLGVMWAAGLELSASWGAVTRAGSCLAQGHVLPWVCYTHGELGVGVRRLSPVNPTCLLTGDLGSKPPDGLGWGCLLAQLLSDRYSILNILHTELPAGNLAWARPRRRFSTHPAYRKTC